MARRPVLAQPNPLDKVIGWFSPKAEQRRLIVRSQTALLGGYNGARRDKSTTASWNPYAGGPTSDAVTDLPTLRARSRDEMRNSAVASGALNGAVTGIVGTGLSATPAIDHEALGISFEAATAWNEETRRYFNIWAESEDCDAARANDFYAIQELAERTWLESGDGFVLTPRIARAGRAARLALQLIEGDRVCNPSRRANTATMIEGVEIAPQTQEAIAYQVAQRHPGELLAAASNTWTRVAARGTNGRRNVLHLFKQLRPGQVRGMPWISPILEPLKQLDRWTENELNAAVTSSIFSVFAKMDPQAFQDIFDEDGESQRLIDDRSKWTGDLESGKLINLLPGEEVGSIASSRPNPAFDPFWIAIVRQIGMALEVPYEVLVMHFQSSYSAARGALLMAWKFYKGRRDLLAKKLCQPVYELWLADEIAEGRIAAPGYFADEYVRAAYNKCLWTGDGPGSIDPQKEVGAARDRVALGISTLAAESVLHDGVDWATKHRQRVVEINAQKADGIYTPPPGSAAVEPAEPPDAPEPPMPSATENAIAAQSLATANLAGRMLDVVQAQSQGFAGAIAQVAARPLDLSAMQEIIPALVTAAQPVLRNQIDVHVPPQAAPAVHNHIDVQPADVKVETPAPVVNITNEVQPAPVTVNNAFPASAEQTVERDSNDEIIKTKTRYT
jgi:lambda family phage portal protein